MPTFVFFLQYDGGIKYSKFLLTSPNYWTYASWCFFFLTRWEGTIAQISRSMCHCGLKLQADKETGARRGESVPAGGEGACAPSRARTAAHPRAQAQWRAPANTPDLLVHPRESPAPFMFNPVSLSSGLRPLGD
jgi:hypothetical protein